MIIFNHKTSCKFFSLKVALLVKKLPANMQETWETQVQSLGLADSLEEGIATYSIILAWRILRTEEPGSLQSL